jgi:glycosyltransferase involved in cell wall biosynthesis
VIQHLQSGLLIPPQDVAALRGAILTIRDDERLRRSLSAGALDRSTQFNLTKTVTRYREELLR